jgi:D-lactate dehydrogenase
VRIAFFNTRPYDRQFFDRANEPYGHELHYLDPHLVQETAVLAAGDEAVCAFVNDDLSAPVLERLHGLGIRLVALRSAGYNHVDLGAAAALGLPVCRVPAYSPYAVAEHAAALLLALNRKVHRAHARIREGNFALDGLLGFDLHGRTVGVIGTGEIGTAFARIMAGFGCTVLAHDPFPSEAARAAGCEYVALEELYARSDVVALHLPLTTETYHLIDAAALAAMKDGVVLINTSRGALVNTKALIDALKSGKLGALGLDVYEEEAALFFEDRSGQVLQDDLFARLTTFPNVLVTGHQAFFTEDALRAIAGTTLANAAAFERGEPLPNEVGAAPAAAP